MDLSCSFHVLNFDRKNYGQLSHNGKNKTLRNMGSNSSFPYSFQNTRVTVNAN